MSTKTTAEIVADEISAEASRAPSSEYLALNFLQDLTARICLAHGGTFVEGAYFFADGSHHA